MRKLFYTSLFVLFGTFAINAQVISCFVSSSSGNDVNDGKSIRSPLKTINKALDLGFKTIFLKCGDVFFEELNLKNTRIDSYGSGVKPLFSGFRKINSENLWELVDSVHYVWRIKLTNAQNFSGFKVSDSTYNDVGLIHNTLTDEVFGHKVAFKTKMQLDASGIVDNGSGVQKYSYLKDCYDFYQEDLAYLYWRLDQNLNPNTIKGLEFACSGICIRMNRSTIRNVKIEGFHYGILKSETPTYDILVDHVDLDLIGGSTSSGNNTIGTGFLRSGNGIEFWVVKDIYNVKVENCSFKRIFDCGVTLQGNSMINGKTLKESTIIPTARNVVFSHNIFSNCRQACEWFLSAYSNGKENGEEVPFVNCEFSNNICIASGDNYFSSKELRDAHILAGSTNLVVKNNTFYGGNYYMLRHQLVSFGKNVVYIERGKYLCANDNKTKMVFVPTQDRKTWVNQNCHNLKEATEAAISLYRIYTGDNGTRFKIIEDADDTGKNTVNNFFMLRRKLSLKKI